MDDIDYLNKFKRIRVVLRWSYIVPIAIFSIYFILGKLRFWQSLITIDHISPNYINFCVAALILGYLIWVIYYWVCPRCGRKLYFSLNASIHSFNVQCCDKCRLKLE